MPRKYLPQQKLMISVSVVIPTLNEARNIEPLLRALAAQQFAGDLQIIVSDGASQDGTLETVRAFVKSDSSVPPTEVAARPATREASTFVNASAKTDDSAVGGLAATSVAGNSPQVLAIESERGVSRQRNAGARQATGELIFFMDADDRPAPNFVRDVVDSYRRFPFAVACPWFVARDAGMGVRAAYMIFNILFWLGQSSVRTGSGVCIVARRDAWEKCGGFDERLHLGEDVHFLRRAAPRFGWHRHLLVPLETSGRRYARDGFWKLSAFYTRIAPLILCGLWKPLQKQNYRADYTAEK